MTVRPIPSPYGMRGERPLTLSLPPESPKLRLLSSIPGVAADLVSGEFAFPWDLWPTVAGVMDNGWRPKKPTREDLEKVFVGQDKYEEFFLKRPGRQLREQQRKIIFNHGSKDYSGLVLPMRSGKSPILMAILTRRGCQRNIIVPPADLRYNWIREIQTWLPEDTILELKGRKGCEGRFVGERNWIKDGNELIEALERSNWVICHYDIFKPQTIKDGAGKTFWDPKHPGFYPTLRRVTFDGFAMDESHNIKVPWVAGKDTRGDVLAELFKDRTRAKLAYFLTATPTAGLIKHYWQQLRIIAGAPVMPNRVNRKSNDPWQKPDYLPGFESGTAKYGHIWGGIAKPFTERYCSAGHIETDNPHVPGGMIWYEDGESNVAEFQSRLKKVVCTRTPKEMSSGMPEVHRFLELVDPADRKWNVPKNVLSNSGSKERLRRAATKFKCKVAAPRIARAMLAGQKVQVLVDETIEASREAHKHLIKALQKEVGKKGRLPKVWLVNSEDCASVKLRDAYAKAFREYELGGCAYITTSGKAKGGFSLRSATEVHVLGISSKINDHMQAEKRAAEHGEADLNIIYYAIAGSYDEVLMERARNRLELIAKLERNGDAAGISEQLSKMEKDDELCFEALAGGASILGALGLSEGLEGEL